MRLIKFFTIIGLLNLLFSCDAQNDNGADKFSIVEFSDTTDVLTIDQENVDKNIGFNLYDSIEVEPSGLKMGLVFAKSNSPVEINYESFIEQEVNKLVDVINFEYSYQLSFYKDEVLFYIYGSGEHDFLCIKLPPIDIDKEIISINYHKIKNSKIKGIEIFGNRNKVYGELSWRHK
ncbi:MAG: hypothetical protein N4A35_10160 [Flavobacteriales bacterium]|jgi:hypothetical protein|nr:hypothetical protein [Flavobacteriales bacterium]